MGTVIGISGNEGLGSSNLLWLEPMATIKVPVNDPARDQHHKVPKPGDEVPGPLAGAPVKGPAA